MKPIEPVTLDDIRATWRRATGVARRTQLIRINVDDAPRAGRSLADVAEAIRLMVECNHVLAEGAGAAPVAAALAGKADGANVACVVSGGNIDADKLAPILEGGVPE